MKKKLLLAISFLFTTAVFAQNCYFTHSMAGALNVITFTKSITFNTPAYRFEWNFGDGATSSDTAPVHSYNSFGTFNACCYVYDMNQALVCSWCDSVTIGSPAGGGCNFTATVDTVNHVAIFFGQPSTSASTINWDFGNGDTAIGNVVTYLYPSPGTYQVCMTETNNFLGTVLCYSCNSIVMGAAAGGNCSFTAVNDLLNPANVNFTANVAATATVSWDFGDGSANGSGLSTSHSYNTMGPFTVCMTSVDNGVTCTYCHLVSGVNPSTNCSFTSAPDPGNAASITFTGVASLFGSGLFWDFGDGNFGQGNAPTHLYTSPGTYTVCMTEYNSGAIRCYTCNTITVGSTFPACQSYFVAVSLGLTGYFIDLSNVNSGTATYSWDFGDAAVSSNRFVQHNYAIPGTYNVCLTVSDAGCTSTYCTPLIIDTTINNPGTTCRADFAILQIAPFQFVVVNLAGGTNLNFAWDFGDGSPVSNQAYPSHYYSAVGNYNICLTVSNSAGCSDTFCDSLSVDTLGNVFRSLTGFTVNVLSPASLTGVNEISGSKRFAVYPNPVTSVLTVSIASDRKGTSSYKVYTLDGSEFTGGTFLQNENKLNVKDWMQGAYILEVIDSEGFRSYQKIIKE